MLGKMPSSTSEWGRVVMSSRRFRDGEGWLSVAVISTGPRRQIRVHKSLSRCNSTEDHRDDAETPSESSKVFLEMTRKRSQR